MVSSVTKSKISNFLMVAHKAVRAHTNDYVELVEIIKVPCLQFNALVNFMLSISIHKILPILVFCMKYSFCSFS